MNKTFRVIAKSSGPNSFGLFGFILVAQDGESYEVARSQGPWNESWSKGTDVVVPTELCPSQDRRQPVWAGLGVEIPRRLPNAPLSVLAEVFPEVCKRTRPISFCK